MRTTLDVDNDVLDVAKDLAAARQISIGKALSFLARRGAAAHMPITQRNGFAVFTLGADTPPFDAKDVRAALEADDQSAARQFVAPKR